MAVDMLRASTRTYFGSLTLEVDTVETCLRVSKLVCPICMTPTLLWPTNRSKLISICIMWWRRQCTGWSLQCLMHDAFLAGKAICRRKRLQPSQTSLLTTLLQVWSLALFFRNGTRSASAFWVGLSSTSLRNTSRGSPTMPAFSRWCPFFSHELYGIFGRKLTVVR